MRIEYLTTDHQQDMDDPHADTTPGNFGQEWATRLWAGMQVYFNKIHSQRIEKEIANLTHPR